MTFRSSDEKIFNVSELNELARLFLEQTFSNIWVEGEISNLSQPASGHIYFTLKDPHSQIRCAMFRSRYQNVPSLPLKDGLKILVRAKLSLYPVRGDYQLIVQSIELFGEGQLKLAFEALRKRLQEEGLFDPSHKKSLPTSIKTVGIITSPSGAALHDILTTFKRRFKGIHLILYPSSVQGDQAPHELLSALHNAIKHNVCDVLIIARGGGSLEDLWAFNDETLARAIYHCPIPVVSAIGHETDFSISDFVADVRAPTPTAAAELTSIDAQILEQGFETIRNNLFQRIRMFLQSKQQELSHLKARIRHPRDQLHIWSQSLDHLENILQQTMHSFFEKRKFSVSHLLQLLYQRSPKYAIERYQSLLREQQHRMIYQFQRKHKQSQHTLLNLSDRLNTLSPFNTLKRGYAILTHAKTKQVISHIRQLHTGDTIEAKILEGHCCCTVDHVKSDIDT